MATKTPTSGGCIAELQMWIPVSVLAIAKLIAEETRQPHGTFPCPVCRTGTVHWSVASSNGHGRVVCDRQCADGSKCVSAME